jgi:hypothetical protein
MAVLTRGFGHCHSSWRNVSHACRVDTKDAKCDATHRRDVETLASWMGASPRYDESAQGVALALSGTLRSLAVNAYVDPFIGSVRHECHHVIVLPAATSRRVLNEYAAY